MCLSLTPAGMLEARSAFAPPVASGEAPTKSEAGSGNIDYNLTGERRGIRSHDQPGFQEALHDSIPLDATSLP